MLRIGVDFGASKIYAGVVSNNKVIKTILLKTENKIENVSYAIEKLISPRIKFIGIAVPTISSKGIMYETHNVDLPEKFNLKSVIEHRFKVKTKIENDANCFALGEVKFGSARGLKNVVAITLGSGFGAGIIINKKLYTGSFNSAGEFGHIPFKDSELEDYCSGKFFKKHGTTGEAAFRNALNHDKKAVKLLNEFGTNLGQALATIINALSPEAIILGGSISNSLRFFRGPMINELKKWTFKHVKTKIIKSKNKDSIILGAAHL